MEAATDRVGRNDRLSPGGGEEVEKMKGGNKPRGSQGPSGPE